MEVNVGVAEPGFMEGGTVNAMTRVTAHPAATADLLPGQRCEVSSRAAKLGAVIRARVRASEILHGVQIDGIKSY